MISAAANTRLNHFKRSYLWQGAVELMDSVHYIQQHVVTDHRFSLRSSKTGLRQGKARRNRYILNGSVGFSRATHGFGDCVDDSGETNCVVQLLLLGRHQIIYDQTTVFSGL